MSHVRLRFAGFLAAAALFTLGCANRNAIVPPSPAAPGVGVHMATGGGSHTCASLFDGRLLCWGDNALGQLGTGNTNSSRTPVGMPPFAWAPPSHPLIVGIAAGESHTCVIGPGGKIFCVGSNRSGQLGVDSHTDYTTLQPVRMNFLKPDGSPRAAKMIAAGQRHTCAIYEDGFVGCWGFGSTAQPTGVQGIFAEVIAARFNQTCIIATNRTVACWSAQFGAPPAPDVVPGLFGQTAIAVGRSHACSTNGVIIQCWGTNSSGQIGNGSTVSGPFPPTRVSTRSTSRVVDLAAGDLHTCALFDSGAVECWGSNIVGESGNPTRASVTRTPVQVIASGATAIAAGAAHSCAAVVQNGVRRLQCWGANNAGQLGDGTTNNSFSPVLMTGLP